MLLQKTQIMVQRTIQTLTTCLHRDGNLTIHFSFLIIANLRLSVWSDDETLITVYARGHCHAILVSF